MNRNRDRGYTERSRQMKVGQRQRIQRDTKTDERELDTHRENTERERDR